MLDHESIRFADWHSEFSAAISDAPPVPGDPLDQARVDDRRGEEPFAVLAYLADGASSIVLAVNDPVAWRGSVIGIREIKPELAGLQVLAFDDPALAAGNFDHVVMAEPPPAPALAGFSAAHTVFAWSESVARSVAAREADLLLSREHVVKVFRLIKAATDPAESLLEDLRLRMPSARIAGRAVRALEELSVVRVQRSGADVESIHAEDSPKTDLELSFTFRSYSEYREESKQWLRQLSANPRER